MKYLVLSIGEWEFYPEGEFDSREAAVEAAKDYARAHLRAAIVVHPLVKISPNFSKVDVKEEEVQ